METCYPTTADWGCADETLMDEMTEEQRARAEMLGWSALRVLTGFQAGNCPVTVRPCSKGCHSRQTWTEAVASDLVSSSGPFHPRMVDGMLVNSCGCTSDDCSCSNLSYIRLPGPVGEVIEVKLDGVVMPASSYAVFDTRLVRLDGERWPSCQDLTAADTEEGTFSVTYRQGYPIDTMVNIAAGVMAMEFYLACINSSKCRLPANVQSIARQGVSIEISGGIFSGPLTNIPEIDVVIQTLNPYGLKTGPAIWSPDRNRQAVR